MSPRRRRERDHEDVLAGLRKLPHHYLYPAAGAALGLGSPLGAFLLRYWLADPLLKSVWARHELDYKRAAVLGDAVTARTWIGAVDSRRFERFTEIVRANDGVVLARGRTLWCLINRTTRRIARIPDTLRACFPDEGEVQPGE